VGLWVGGGVEGCDKQAGLVAALFPDPTTGEGTEEMQSHPPICTQAGVVAVLLVIGITGGGTGAGSNIS